MLHIIKGRAGSGKTALLRNIINDKLNSSQSRPLLIIPEQFSFETERSMLRFLGAQKLKAIDIFSFSRLATWGLKDLRDISSVPGAGVRQAIMSEALSNLDGRLSVFYNCKSSKGALDSLVDFCKELKYCRIDSSELTDKAELLSEGFLRDKINEISLINDAYDALVTQNYFDDTDALNILCEVALSDKLFLNKTIFIDGFRAFSKQELECFSVMLSQADDVYITLCCDDKHHRVSPFCYIDKFENQLRTIASQNNVLVREQFCTQSDDAFSGNVFSLEKCLFSQEQTKLVKTDDTLKVVQCFDAEDEADFVAKEIKRLLRSGEYRCRDIAVIERSNGTYKNRIIDNLKKLDIPVFDDNRRSLRFEALFIYVDSVLSCLCNGFSQENIFTYLKSGLSSLSLSEISRLEKYAIIWGVTGNAWSEDFKMHPDGFGNSIDDKAAVRLEQLNESRKKAVLPLLKLKKDCVEKTGEQIAENIYNFLIEQRVSDRLYDLYLQLNENGFSVEAQRQSVSWDVLMGLLNTMAKLSGDKNVSVSRWAELFNILVESGDIGEIPQGLDEVRVGSADRIRTEKLKVVFLVGVNKDEFPLVKIKGGVLTDADRVSLTQLGLEIRPPFEDSVDEERFIAYCAVTASSEKLYLTYKTVSNDGSPLLPSEIIETAHECIDGLKVIKTSDLDLIDKIESEEDAFSQLARMYAYNSPEKLTLAEYFSGMGDYAHRLQALERAVGKKHYSFNDSEKSIGLFGSELYLSASRVESFYNCPFSYFVRFGLRAEPLRVAELDPAQGGTVIHLVMENVLARYPKATFVSADEGEIRLLVEEILRTYLEEKMGGEIGKSKRFIFLFDRLVDISMTIIERLKQEFKVGAFEPCDFEMKIGGDDIPAYELPLDSGKLTITGSVDRVDLMEKDGIKYIRVIDYKTGKKDFKLSELYSGLNIQMVLYLMALLKNGNEYYGEFLPAGVLYLPSRIGIADYLDKRTPDTETVQAKRRQSGKLSGMVLNSPVVYNGMGVDVLSDYFPVGYNKKNELVGNNYTLLNFKSLSKIIDNKIIDMGNALHDGYIAAIPSGRDGEGAMCRYCSYKVICNHEFGDEVNEVVSLTHSKALERLEEAENE